MSELEIFQSKFNHFFKRFFDQEIKELEKLGKEYQELLITIKNYCLRGGKRFRPLLAYLAFQSVFDSRNSVCQLRESKIEDEVLRATITLELIHQFILIHDDIIDRDKIRHGGPTVEEEFTQIANKRRYIEPSHFGLSIGLISGDLLFNLAQKNLAAIDSRNLGRLIPGISGKLLALSADALNKTIAGWYRQYLDTNKKLEDFIDSRSPGRLTPGISVSRWREDFYRIQELVTANYSFIFPLQFGLTLAGAGEDLIKKFSKIGQRLGIAYQLQDDILGTFGEEKVSGKSTGNDLKEGKKTLLIIEAYNRGTKEQQARLSQIVGRKNSSPNEIVEIRNLIKQTGSLDYSQRQISKLTQEAKILINGLEIKNKVKAQIQVLVTFLVGRER